MKYKNDDKELDQIIRQSMKIEETPSAELNNRLKARLYEEEAVIQSKAEIYTISLWYVPMILNLLTFLLFAVVARVLISNPFLARMTVVGCCYMGIVGIAVTVLGLKRTNMKSDIALCIRKNRRISHEG